MSNANVTVQLIQLKRSNTSNPPTSLQSGEPAYSFGNDTFYIGDDASNVRIIGGHRYTKLLDVTPGIASGSQAIVLNNNKGVDQLIIGSTSFYGNTIVPVSANSTLIIGGGNISLQSNVTVNGNNIRNLANPINTQDAATKLYVDQRYTDSTTAPTNPHDGDRWLNSNTGVLFTWIITSGNGQWVEV